MTATAIGTIGIDPKPFDIAHIHGHNSPYFVFNNGCVKGMPIAQPAIDRLVADSGLSLHEGEEVRVTIDHSMVTEITHVKPALQ